MPGRGKPSLLCYMQVIIVATNENIINQLIRFNTYIAAVEFLFLEYGH